MARRPKTPKFIFIVGGVISGVGKGITTSSIGKILQSRGLVVTAIKIDPYVNVDAGTMNPTEHGEVFVLEDGDETDQDMGNYERFLGVTLGRDNYMTTGRIYQSVIAKERNLEYGGRCVQVVPHIPLEVIARIRNAAKKAEADVTVIEIGGTVGEYENILFLEAARMMKIETPRDIAVVMVSYLPTPSTIGEMKTKPTQHAVRAVNAAGIQPDIIVARSNHPLDQKRKEKLAVFCNVRAEDVVSAPDVESIYDVPINFERDKLGDRMLEKLSLHAPKPANGMGGWRDFVAKTKRANKPVRIAVIGKYFDTGDFTISDSYISVIEAVKYSAYHAGKKPELAWLSAVDFEKDPKKLANLKQYDGIIVPGGFGARGTEGLIAAIRYAREHKIPYLGLCYGMQLMVIEYARNVVRLGGAHTTEVDQRALHPVIDIMPEQKAVMAKKEYGGSMRLGAYKAVLKRGSVVREAYGKDAIFERHRHRYEVNPEYISQIENAGLVFSGKSPNGMLMEFAELPKKAHPFFVGTQAHPEFLAHPLAPHPLFDAFMKAAIKKTR